MLFAKLRFYLLFKSSTGNKFQNRRVGQHGVKSSAAVLGISLEKSYELYPMSKPKNAKIGEHEAILVYKQTNRHRCTQTQTHT